MPLQQQPNRPKKGRGRIFVAAAIIAAILAAGGVWLAVTVLGADTGNPPVDNSAFQAAHTPADKVAAALHIMRDSGSVRSTATRPNGTRTVSRADFGNHVISGEMTTNQLGAVEMVALGEGAEHIYVRFADGLGPIKPNVWYRAPSSMVGAVGASLDSKYFDEVLAASPSVVEQGAITIDGIDATHYVATVNKSAMLDYMLSLFDFASSEPGVDTETMRSAMASAVPDTLDFAIDDSGRLIQTIAGDTTTRFDQYGESFDAPDIDESTVEQLPGS
ncbi:hypothetical protein OG921_01465 [Aldersonia sp. NBC_00410]|uniref:hypothetical protein n=1 Tax=Aldersonia sp. NBC_00410 TaxID=2975954 RepID=UPI002257EC97|nr:hypothetical protein [Aldersonia sp. NBC_00410]MCX5041861.1 hypothetical protein [Aldersonia sp. NBC_00410]